MRAGDPAAERAVRKGEERGRAAGPADGAAAAVRGHPQGQDGQDRADHHRDHRQGPRLDAAAGARGMRLAILISFYRSQGCSYCVPQPCAPPMKPQAAVHADGRHAHAHAHEWRASSKECVDSAGFVDQYHSARRDPLRHGIYQITQCCCAAVCVRDGFLVWTQ